jgi:hypothetical protein
MFDSQVGWPPRALVPPMFEPEDSFVWGLIYQS